MIIDLNIKNRYEFRFLLFDDYLNFEGENFEGENFKGCPCDIYIVLFAKSLKYLREIFQGMIIDLNIRNRYEFRFLLFDDYLNFEGENFEDKNFEGETCDVYIVCQVVETFKKNFLTNNYRFKYKKSIRVQISSF